MTDWWSFGDPSTLCPTIHSWLQHRHLLHWLAFCLPLRPLNTFAYTRAGRRSYGGWTLFRAHCTKASPSNSTHNNNTETAPPIDRSIREFCLQWVALDKSWPFLLFSATLFCEAFYLAVSNVFKYWTWNNIWTITTRTIDCARTVVESAIFRWFLAGSLVQFAYLTLWLQVCRHIVIEVAKMTNWLTTKINWFWGC